MSFILQYYLLVIKKIYIRLAGSLLVILKDKFSAMFILKTYPAQSKIYIIHTFPAHFEQPH